MSSEKYTLQIGGDSGYIAKEAMLKNTEEKYRETEIGRQWLYKR